MSRSMRRHFSPVKRVSSLILRAKPWLANKVLRHAIVLPRGFADSISRRERSDDRKCVCCSQAILNAVAVKCVPPPSWFFAVESKILFYIFLVESRTPLMIEIQQTASMYMECTWNPESKAWNPESNSALDSITLGAKASYQSSKRENAQSFPNLNPSWMIWKITYGVVVNQLYRNQVITKRPEKVLQKYRIKY